MRRGGVGKLTARYGSRLAQKTNDDGLQCFQLLGRFGGKPVFTSFTVDGLTPSSRILMVFILYGRAMSADASLPEARFATLRVDFRPSPEAPRRRAASGTRSGRIRLVA